MPSGWVYDVGASALLIPLSAYSAYLHFAPLFSFILIICNCFHPRFSPVISGTSPNLSMLVKRGESGKCGVQDEQGRAICKYPAGVTAIFTGSSPKTSLR